jgi:predicted O-linked N-acetylglucosamine transferase (SPINDLY family)
MSQLRVFGAQPAYRRGDEVADLFAQATAHHRAGQLARAQAGYKKVLKKRPNHFNALQMLAVSEHQSGNFQSAERLLRRALLVNPQSDAARCDLGVVLAALQRPDEALACYDGLIASKPDFVNAHLNRGNLLLRLRRFAEAVTSYDKLIAINPQHIDALFSKGEALHELARFTDAISCYDRILAVKPADARALVNRGAAFKDLRRANEAIADFDLALAIDPNNTVACVNRGETLLALGRLDEALASFDRALSINAELELAWLGRANILMMTKKVTEALAACQRVLAIQPNSAKALAQIGQCHAFQGDAEAAVLYFDRSLAIKPDEETVLSNRIFTLDFSHEGDYARDQAARSEWWRQIGSKIAVEHPAQHENDLDPARRIVVGYISAEFRQHSSAYTFRPVLRNHDKSRFEVICYSSSLTEDDVTGSFRDAADRWRNVLQWSDHQLADCIRSDKVDILIDLSGHTGGNRLRTFARKPAPIQVTAWGHATGTGLPTIDYLFADPVMIPSEVRDLFAEQIYDLPCAIIIEPPPLALRSSEPPATSNGYLTYGVFTRASRISDAVIGVWARILHSDVTSRLLIKDYLIDDFSIRTRLLENFAAHGIAPDRILLIGSTSREEHLAAYGRIDICLDPFPHGGGVSTWESLHMGVPVVTKLGNGTSRRVGGAFLSAIGMTDWTATNDDQYVEIALRSTADRLKTIRRELPDLIDRRCGPAAYTRAVEEGYRTMWEKYCSGQQGQPGGAAQRKALEPA